MFSVRLHRARKAAGLSLRDLGGLVGVSHAAIKKYEDGAAMPSSEILIGLSHALKVRSEYFFRPQVPVELEGIEYRKRSSLPQKRLDAITHEVIDQIERRLELENLLPRPLVNSFEPVSGLPGRITAMEQIEDVAESVRKAWDLGLGPIPDLMCVLESNGIRIFMIEAGAEHKFDGLAARVKSMPFVVVGQHWPGDRQRFTLAHELGHLMMTGHISESLNEEMVCNRFAGAFLFPRASVLQKLGEHRNALELKELEQLKNEFGLSMAGILYRARDLGIISPANHEKQVKLFRHRGWRKKEPGRDYPSEKAHFFEQQVFRSLSEEYIGESKAAELLNMPLEEFCRIRLM